MNTPSLLVPPSDSLLHDATDLAETQRGERLHAMSLRLSMNCERLGREDKQSANKRGQHKQSAEATKPMSVTTKLQ